MPLLKGKKNQRKNFDEFRHGKTFAKTEKKFGKKRALKQMEAVVLGASRGGRKLKSKRKTARKRA